MAESRHLESHHAATDGPIRIKFGR